MKNWFLFSLLFSLFALNASAQPKQKTLHVQMCLDDLYNAEHNSSYKKAPIYLIKNEYSDGIENLHYGAVKLILTKATADEDKNKIRFFKIIGYSANSNQSKISLYDRRAFFAYNLIKENNKWVIKNVEMTVNEPSIEPPR